MFKYVLIAVIVLPTFTFAQKLKFSINGSISMHSPKSKVYLSYEDEQGKMNFDSSNVTNGNFHFSGIIANPGRAAIALDHTGEGLTIRNMYNKKDTRLIYLDAGVIRIVIKDSILSAKVTGPETTNDFEVYNGSVSPFNKERMQVIDESLTHYRKDPKDTLTRNEFRKKSEEIGEHVNDLTKQFIYSHPDSYVSLDLIRSMGSGSVIPKIISPLFNSLSDRIKKTSAGQRVSYELSKAGKIVAGIKAPVFSQPDINGKMVSLNDFKGKYVLVDFWASWCSGCRAENPRLVKVYEKYKDRGFTIVSISLDDASTKAAWITAIKKDGLVWTNVSDLQRSNAAAKLYGVTLIPRTFLIDPNGVIIAKDWHAEELFKKLDVVLK
ncbi:hypothetical protein A9P82_14545 [Arachidicoccus ginsenosidimutans]|uniref:TlpA disulfide reductase family protein n=1 Tax=Arachidicoccus sp. BS20 TaxID=1850526 RepID=UPI0007F09E8A|nr:TlpA disulfide reductase family protein [Arachidicoccus sp. BS20]ANI90398.1 hypothetical protein A9P82_14545 [Arachidicoccus sp. BS20]